MGGAFAKHRSCRTEYFASNFSMCETKFPFHRRKADNRWCKKMMRISEREPYPKAGNFIVRKLQSFFSFFGKLSKYVFCSELQIYSAHIWDYNNAENLNWQALFYIWYCKLCQLLCKVHSVPLPTEVERALCSFLSFFRLPAQMKFSWLTSLLSAGNRSSLLILAPAAMTRSRWHWNASLFMAFIYLAESNGNGVWRVKPCVIRNQRGK
jgi:hypothetical protein